MHDDFFSLKGRVALVTGVSSGLGRHFSQMLAYECARRLVRSGAAGSIINIASKLGLTTQLKQTAYSVSKTGVAPLTRMMALELIRPATVACERSWIVYQRCRVAR